MILWPNIRRFIRAVSPFSWSAFRALEVIEVGRPDAVGDVVKSRRERGRNYNLG